MPLAALILRVVLGRGPPFIGIAWQAVAHIQGAVAAEHTGGVAVP